MTHPHPEKPQPATFAPLAEMAQTDLEKLVDYASALMHLPPPKMDTQKGNEVVRWMQGQVFALAQKVLEKAGEV